MADWALYDQFSKNVGETVEVSGAQVGLKQGNIAPDFQLMTLNGKIVKLSDYRGKKVVLNFWATWCPPCKAEIPHMQDFYEERSDEIEILAVNLEENNKLAVKKFVDDYGMTFPVLLDTENVGDRYQAFTIPTSYIIDTNGMIAHKIVGPMSKELMGKMVKSLN